MWDWSKSLCLNFGLKLTKCFHIHPFHSHDLNINSPHSLSYFAYSVSSENMVLNQTISPSWFFSWFSSPVCNDIGEIIYWSLLGVKGIFTVIYSSLLGFIWNQHSNQLLVGSSAQLVEHCTGIAKVMPYFHYCSSTVYYCKDCFNSYSLLYPQFTSHSFSLFYSII